MRFSASNGNFYVKQAMSDHSGTVGENVARRIASTTTPQRHVGGWTNSQSHRHNIIGQRSNSIGVGVYFIIEDGIVVTSTATQKFGR